MRTPGLWSLPLVVSLIIGSGGVSGCAHRAQPRDSGRVAEAEADSRSGPDGVLKGAVLLPVGEARDLGEDGALFQIYEGSGEVSWPARQRTRWRLVELNLSPLDADTPLRCELRYQPEGAALSIDAWSAAAAQLPDHHDSAPGLYVAEVFVDSPAQVYLRIRAGRPQDVAQYTLRCSLHYASTAKIYNEEHARRSRPRRPTQPDPWQAPDFPIEARIVSIERKDDKQLLTINKGAIAGVKVGQRGTIFEGKSGREPLVGGAFEIREVTDNSCIAETTAKHLGKNTRVGIMTK